MSLSSVLAMGSASRLNGPMCGALERKGMEKMKRTLRTVHPALHERLLKRLLHEITAERLSSVLVVPPQTGLKNPITRLQEASALERLKRTIGLISPGIQDKVLNTLLRTLSPARPSSPYNTLSRAPQPRPTTRYRWNGSTLNTLPAEVRIQIFKHALAEEWNGFVPALIKALRPEIGMYSEAIEVYFNPSQIFLLYSGNGWSFLDMPDELLHTIHRIKIILRDGEDPRITDYPASKVLVGKFWKCRNVHEVIIESTFGMGGFFPMTTNNHITRFLAGFWGLRRVVFRFPNNLSTQQQIHANTEPHPGDPCGPIERCNKLLGAIGRTTEVSTLRRLNRSSFRLRAGFLQILDNWCGYLDDSVREEWVRGLLPPFMETWVWEGGPGDNLDHVCVCEADLQVHSADIGEGAESGDVDVMLFYRRAHHLACLQQGSFHD